MKIKALKSFKGKEGFFYKGHIKNVKKDYADELIKRGLAVEVKEKEEDIKEVKVDKPKETKKAKK